MKSRIFTVALILSIAFYCPISFSSIENPGVGNPVGSSTIPPSYTSNGLVSTPSPIDTNGNLLITGNVRRGRYFRGEVPYRSVTSFGSNLGTSTLSSFLRDTAGSEDLSRNTNRYGTQPYYSPTETVTTMMPGRTEIFRPASSSLSTRVQQDTRVNGSRVEFQASEQALQSQATQYAPKVDTSSVAESKFSSGLSLKPQDRIRFEPAQIDIHRQQNQTSSFGLFREQIQNISNRAQNSMSAPVHENLSNLSDNNTSFRYSDREINSSNVSQNYESQKLPLGFIDNEKQSTSNQYSHKALSGLKSSMESETQGSLFLQKDKSSSVTKNQFLKIQEQNTEGNVETGTEDSSFKAGIERAQQQVDVLERIRQQLDDLTKTLNSTTQSLDDNNNHNTKAEAEQDEAPLGYQRYLPRPLQTVPHRQNDFEGNSKSSLQLKSETSFEAEKLRPSSNTELNRFNGSEQAGTGFSGISNNANAPKGNSPLQQLNRLSQAEISAKASRIMGAHNSFESLTESKFNRHMHEAEAHIKAGRYYRAADCFSLASIYQPENFQAIAGRGHALFAAGEYVSSALFLSRALEINPEYLLTKVNLVEMLGGENKLAERIADAEQWLARSGSSQLQFLLGYVYYRTGQFVNAKKDIDAAYEKQPDSPALQAMKIVIGSVRQ